VKATIHLADERRVELIHDLDRRLCQVRDADLPGHDYAAEILNEGTPDGSKWLGLDRASFLAVACIRQADILGVIEDAGALQEHIQRAAAGGDTTAAAALALLLEFKRDRVGSEQVNARGPLRMAMNRLADAELTFTRAEGDHRAYLELAAQVDELALKTAQTESYLQIAKAAAALEAWNQRPAIPVIRGRKVDEIRKDLDGLPEVGDGDAEVHTDVQSAEGVLGVARLSLTLHADSEPPRPDEDEPSESGKAFPIAAAALFAVGIVAWLLVHPLAGVLLMFGGVTLFVRTRGDGSARSVSRREWERWEHQRTALEKGVTDAKSKLADALGLRGVAVGDDVDDALQSYREDCQARAKKSQLTVELADRLEAERQAAEVDKLRARADQALLTAAAQCGVVGTSVDKPAESLRKWIDDKSQEIGIGRDSLKNVEEIEHDLQEASSSLNVARGRLAERARQLKSVAEAKEELTAAQDELQRIRELGRVLDLTAGFLGQAQERAHRDIAPVLSTSVSRWLPSVTMNRYADVRVDPETLDVQVYDRLGRWRRAVRLSHGTTEQVYLLLRVAMAEHLTRAGESCPLLLDDVTAQSDRMRTKAILEVLHGVSQEHQVILFTQEDEVLEWARSSLGNGDQFIEL